MKLDDMGLAFSQECLRAALLVSLLSVWVLVGLFYYLNRYAKRDYFSIWTGGWLFYAMWMTLSLGMGQTEPSSVLFTVDQTCISMSAAMLLWGSMRFLGMPVPQKFSALVSIFLAAWIVLSPQLMTNSLQIHLPVFILLGLSSPFAGVCFIRLRREKSYVGLGLLSLSLLLWVIYVGSYPFRHASGSLFTAGFLLAAGLQLFIAVSMIIALTREITSDAAKVRAEMEALREERFKVVTTKEACEHLYNRMLATETNELAVANMRKAQQSASEKEQIDTLNAMARDIAHEINNALSPVTAYSELLLNTLPNLPEVPRKRLQRISQAADEVAQIVAHMREYCRPATDPAPSADHSSGVTLKERRATKLDPDLPCASAPSRPLRILCIDDEPQLRDVLRDILGQHNHSVKVAANGKVGLEMFRSSLHKGEPYEVVITDLAMPDIDGHYVARTIKAESPETPIIMLTGWGTMLEVDRATADEVDAVLGKPPRAQELSNVLSQIMARSAN
jgi:CheY-like chemotaxis protein